MKKVNDIFYSLQGEGFHTGRAAVFIRFAMCNLKCPFCDTNFTTYREMSDEDILQEILPYPAKFVVLTGGEPTLQVDKHLIDLLHKHNYYVAMETNGTRKPTDGIDWITCSPKENVVITECNELKVIFDGKTSPHYYNIRASHYYLQPCDTGNIQENKRITNDCIEYIKQHPEWRLSLQTHKLSDFK